MDGRMVEWMDRKSPILQDVVPYRDRCPKIRKGQWEEQKVGKTEITRPDTQPGISRESLPLANFLDKRTNGWTDGQMDGRTGVRDDWYPLWEA